jgi:hypothetical protein
VTWAKAREEVSKKRRMGYLRLRAWRLR